MLYVFYALIFMISCGALYLSGEWILKGMVRMAKFLGWREFVIAFFVMAFGASLPNFFVGISAVIHNIPELSFGEVVGGNFIDLTLAVALATLVAKKLPTSSKTLQITSFYTMIIAVLPFLLVLDGTLSRGDGIILVLVFLLYTVWLFSKKERFVLNNNENKNSIIKEFKIFIKDFGKLILGIIFLLVAAEGIVRSSTFFAESFSIPLSLVGILIVGLGNAIPETYFAVAAARKKETWMILGNLLGAVTVPATLVLGLVAILSPFNIYNLTPFSIAYGFLIVSAALFLLFIRTGKELTRKEAIFLLGIYILFIAFQILAN